MGIMACLAANTLYDIRAGGHLWVSLNWALGLQAAGCRVIWLEPIDVRKPKHETEALIAALKTALRPYGFADSVALCVWGSERPVAAEEQGCGNLEEAVQADLLLNLTYDGVARGLLARFRRSALVDIDHGLTQIWTSENQLKVPPHDFFSQLVKQWVS